MRLLLTTTALAAAVMAPAPAAAGDAPPGATQAAGALQRAAARAEAQSLTVRIELDGRNPCRAILINYGDGEVEALTIGALPATFLYDYGAPGSYRITVQGSELCGGNVTTTVRVGAGSGRDTSTPVQPSSGAMRFRALDRDADGVITRSEWRGNARSFDVHDWNGDGVLSGAEVRSSNDAADDDSLILTPDARQAIVVDPRGPWTATPVVLAPGDIVTFEVSGTVYLNEARTDIADPAGARNSRTAPASPLPRQPAGALIARIGNGPAFFVGDTTRGFRVTTAGTLYLGVNDDFLDDNSGQFYVVVTRR